MNSYEKIYNLLLEEALIAEQKGGKRTFGKKVRAGVLGAALALGGGGKATAKEPTQQPPRFTYTTTRLPGGRLQLDFGGTGKETEAASKETETQPPASPPSDTPKKAAGALAGAGLLARAIQRKRKDKKVERRLRDLEAKGEDTPGRHEPHRPTAGQSWSQAIRSKIPGTEARKTAKADKARSREGLSQAIARGVDNEPFAGGRKRFMVRKREGDGRRDPLGEKRPTFGGRRATDPKPKGK